MDNSTEDDVLDLSNKNEIRSCEKHTLTSPSPPVCTTYPPPMDSPYQPLIHSSVNILPAIPINPYQVAAHTELYNNSPPPPLIPLVSPLLSPTYPNTRQIETPTRPFKHTRGELALSLVPSNMLGQESSEEYLEFRRKKVSSLNFASSNNKCKKPSNPEMAQTSKVDKETAAYWERRRKNNEAVKRSRDARKAKIEELATSNAFLQLEYVELKIKLEYLKKGHSCCSGSNT